MDDDALQSAHPVVECPCPGESAGAVFVRRERALGEPPTFAVVQDQTGAFSEAPFEPSLPTLKDLSMSKRERWIVYPLLFFALSLGFRERVRTEASYLSLDVQQLKVRRINGRPAVIASPSPAFDSKLIRDTIQSALESLTPDKPTPTEEADDGEAEVDGSSRQPENDQSNDEPAENDDVTNDRQSGPPTPDHSADSIDSVEAHADEGGAVDEDRSP